jgi:hypothetical protein
VAADVVEHDWPLLEEGAEHAVGAGQLADLGGAPLGDAEGAEAGEAAAAVGDAEGGVAGLHRPARGAQHPVEDAVELGAGGERQQIEDLPGERVPRRLPHGTHRRSRAVATKGEGDSRQPPTPPAPAW